MNADAPFHAEHESPGQGAPARRWRQPFTWLTLLSLGWVLYELTTQPTVGAVAVCIKFGWEDFRAAIWLRRVDPRRLRGRACFWLYLASGLAKTAGVACLMSFAFVFISPRGPAAQGPRGAAIIEMFAWTGLTMLAGLGCATLALAYAAVLARWGGFKLWLSSDIHLARRLNVWPPYGPSIVQNNLLKFLVIGALLVGFIPVCILICVVAIRIIGVGVVIVFYGFPVLILLCRDRMHLWLIASHPGECWDTDTEPLSDAENMAETFSNPVK